uniref:Uncharacterized protein n=1 Tax=Leersia perrieri TaxID=77586 RepID=A0A0D9X115_9ORYZ
MVHKVKNPYELPLLRSHSPIPSLCLTSFCSSRALRFSRRGWQCSCPCSSSRRSRSIWRRIEGAGISADGLAGQRSSGANDIITCVSFTLLSLATALACVLEARPAAEPRRPASNLPWAVAGFSWLCISAYFVACTTFGGHVAPTPQEWAVAGVAAAVNLAVAAVTVERHFFGVTNFFGLINSDMHDD